jgi:hypothetical protein
MQGVCQRSIRVLPKKGPVIVDLARPACRAGATAAGRAFTTKIRTR